MSLTLGRLVEVNPSVPEFMNRPDNKVTFMPLECVWPDGRADISRRVVASAVSSGYTLFRRGDVLVPKITPTFEAGRVALAAIDTPVGAGTTELHVLRPAAGVDARFVAYVCRSQQFLQDGATRLQGVGNLRRVPAEFIARFPVDEFAFTAQREIADYLDRETARIDVLIQEQQRLIEMLIERRASVVDSVVTAGLNPAASTVDSEVEWIGQIPDHWQVRPLWSMFRRIKDVDHPGEQMLSVFRDYGVVAKDSRTNINQTAENRSIYQLVHPGWLVTNRMKAWQGSVGISSLRGIVSGHYICFAPLHSENHEYLNWLFRSPRYAVGYGLKSRGVRIGQAEIDNDEYRVLPVVIPPLDEQVAIASYLHDQTRKIDRLITETERCIELSKERRAALITAAVTGQIDVSEAA